VIFRDRLRDTAASAEDAINARVAGMKDGVSDLAGSAIDSSRDFGAAAKSAASSARDVGLQVARDARAKHQIIQAPDGPCWTQFRNIRFWSPGSVG